jgi:hypothetical protein
MDLIILNDGLYHLVEVSKEMLGDIKDPLNQHIMKDGSGDFYGCICR